MPNLDKKSKKKFSVIYDTFHSLVWIGTQLFYKNFTVHGLENMPQDDTPTILVGNHQNGMMDPIMMCMASGRQLHFLTRADIFQKKSVNKILRSVNMLPIYRPHDRKVNAKKKNEETIQESVERVLNGNVISLFPEGNHNNKKFLRPLKPGVNKLISEVLRSSEEDIELHVVPVGLNYNNYTDFRSDLFIEYGEPLIISKQKLEESLNEVQFGQYIRSEIFDKLSKTIINIEDREAHDAIEGNVMLSNGVLLESQNKPTDPLNSFEAQKEFLNKIELDKNTSLKKEYVQLGEEYNELKQKSGVDEIGIESFTRGLFSKSKFLILSVLGLPFLLIGFLSNILPAFFTSNFVKNNIKDPHFISSIKLAVGTLTYFFYYLILFTSIWIVFGFLWAAFSIFLIAGCGYLFIRFYDNYEVFKKIKKVENLDPKIKSEILLKRENLLSLATQISA